MKNLKDYPLSQKLAFEENNYENIIDSNMLSPYISENLNIPKIDDPRMLKKYSIDKQRHPGYIKSSHINQIFNYIGFIKRIQKNEYKIYLPILYKELNKFLNVLENIVIDVNISINEDVYNEQITGFDHFFDAYNTRHRGADWIDKIWKHQKMYIDRVNMLLKTIKLTGRVFNYNRDPLVQKIYTFCKNYFHDLHKDPPSDVDIYFVANSYAKAVNDCEPKTIWSGDHHILKIMKVIHKYIKLPDKFTMVYLRASYSPHHFCQLFPV